MNTREREAVERMEHYLQNYGHTDAPVFTEDLRTILAAVRRHERLANEGLTEKESRFIRDFWRPALEPKAESISTIIAKLQAQLAEAREHIIKAEGIASDALEDRGLPRIEEVRREAARECVEIIKGLVIAGSEFSTVRKAAIAAIRRRFGLAAPQPAETPLPETWIGTECQACHGSGVVPCPNEDCSSGIEYGYAGRIERCPTCRGDSCLPCNTCNGRGRMPPQPAGTQPTECHYCQGTGDGGPSLYCPRCGGSGRTQQPAETPPAVCQRCHGSGRVFVASETDGFAAGLVRCDGCAGTGHTPPPDDDDDRRSIRRCLEDRP